MTRLDIQQIEDIAKLKAEYQTLASREHNLRVLHEFALGLVNKHSIDEIVWSIAKNAIAKLGFEDCVIYLVDPSRSFLVQKAAHGPKNPQEMDILNPITIPIGEGIVGTAAKSKKTIIVADTSQDSRYILDDEFRYSELAIPILSGEEVIGVIDSEHPEKNFFTKQHTQLLQMIAAMASSKILHAKAVEELKHYQKNLEKEVAEKTKSLETYVAQLKKSNDDLESFAYATSHDLAEPLRTIIGFLQLLQKKESDLQPESQGYIKFVVNAAHRMQKLMDGLLVYARVGKSKEGFEQVDVDKILATVKSNLSSLIKGRDALIFHGNFQPIFGREVSILQLFQNLIINAIKFQKPDQQPKIRIEQEDRISHFLYKVVDNGIGIPTSNHQNVFKLFRRLNANNHYRGSGIGLAICKSIVENHGGEIWLESEEGKGTTVFFTIEKRPI